MKALAGTRFLRIPLFFAWLIFFVPLLTQDYLLCQPIRAVWVTRWDYRSPGDIHNIMANLAGAGFNLVLFQVRGNGTVFYPSRFEPWAEELGGRDPGWNPLATAIDEAHSQGLRLYAWLNVFPGWRGKQPPANPQQLFNAHPDWFLADEDGTSLPLNPHYVWLNPVLPQVQQHLSNIVQELAAVPGLDGLHFDYFRFPGPGASYDSTTLALFRQTYGISAWDSTELWDRFRRDAITSWLRKNYRKIKAARPEFVFSAAIIGDYDNGPDVFLQDSHRWLAEGIMDAVFPMTYTDDLRLFERWLKRHAPYRHGRALCPGIMVYPDTATVFEELRIVRKMGLQGFSLFAYSSLFPDHQPTELARVLGQRWQVAPVPQFEIPAGPAPLYFRRVQVLPPHPRAADSLRIACTLGGDSSATDSLACLTLWENDGIFPVPQILRLRRSTSRPEIWYSGQTVSPQGISEHFYAQAVAYRRGQVRRTAVHSELLHVIIDAATDRYRQASGRFGPLMLQPSVLAADDSGRVWVWEPGAGLHRLTADGKETPRSTMQTYQDSNGRARPLKNIVGLQFTGDNRLRAAMVTSGRTLILTAQPEDSVFLLQTAISGQAMRAAFDGRGRIYLLQKDGWSVFAPDGAQLASVSFGRRHSPNGIAVSPDGETVLISCRTEGSVHRWQRAAPGGARVYTRAQDLPVANVGLGGVFWGLDGTVLVCHVPDSYVTVLDRHFRTVDYLIGGKPALRVPRAAVSSPSGELIYVLPTGGMTPVRLQQWKKISSQAE